MGSIWGFRSQRDRIPALAARRGVLATRVNAHFLSLADGSMIFYPQAEYGWRGYVVSSDAQQALLRKRARQLHVALFIAYFAPVVGVSHAYSSGILHPEWWQMAIVVAGLATIEWSIRRITFHRFTKHMTISSTHNSPIAHWQSMGKTMNPLILFLSTSFLVTVAIAGLFFAIRQGSWLLFFCFVAVSPSVLIGGIGLQSWWGSGSR